MEELVITREFKADKEKVFDAWSDPGKLAQWWGAKGFTTTVKAFDLKPNGIFHYCFQSQDGHKIWGKFVYQDVKVPDRIVFVNSFSDEQDHITRAPFSGHWPLEISNTMTLTEENGTTTLTLKGRPVNALPEEEEIFDANFENMRQGFAGTFDCLVAFLCES